MPGDDQLESGGNPAFQKVPRELHAANRQLFHEMVRGEVEDHDLNWIQRRDLVRFAQSLRIEPSEAKLIIRAVEFELERADTTPAHESGNIRSEYLADPWPHTERIYHYILISGWVLLTAGAVLMMWRKMP